MRLLVLGLVFVSYQLMILPHAWSLDPQITPNNARDEIVVSAQKRTVRLPSPPTTGTSQPQSVPPRSYSPPSTGSISGGSESGIVSAPVIDSGPDEILDLFCTDGVADLCQPTVLLGNTFGLLPDAPAAAVPAAAAAAPGPPQPQLTLAMIQQAFAQVPVPSSQIVVQPPDGETLVHFPTIYSTEAPSFVESLTLLGRRVDLQIRPVSYLWVHGDGTTQTTDWPGRAWQRGVDMGEYLSHDYDRTATGLDLRVDVTWTADFRVDGGAWQPVNGTVSVTGPSEQLNVLEADPLLVGRD